MMDEHTLYIDNFRGFKDAHIPILDVNFLVGENSSGKTSILSLLKLMSERFLANNQFRSDEVDLGTFDDIASAATDDPYFRIGMTRWNVESGKRSPLAMLVTYAKHDGRPQDIFFSCTFEDRELTLRRVGVECLFKSNRIILSPTTDIRKLIDKWADDHRHPVGGFRKLAIHLDPEESLLYPLSLVAQGHRLRSNPGYIQTLDPRVFPPLAWVAPVRTKPRRTYDELQIEFSSEGTHTPYLIRKILDNRTKAERFIKALQVVGKGSGLFRNVEIKRFGSDVTAPFQVRIVLDKKAFNLTNVGYGVSQALPVLVEILWRTPGWWFSIQQPEVHLHPRAQAALGELIFAMADADNKRFLIETHSDFMIDRYRLNMKREKSRKKIRSQILFFERRRGINTATPIAISERGDLAAEQPAGYRDFFVNEQIEILGL